ncbi:uncharacterized protein [Nicotiana sylvestris]|uniref:uncharacterized protein n=1 Tax=Nicotiana sylvestris TaxID=4096 RepID=UPI00388C4610
MNIIRKKNTVKNSRKEEYDLPQQLDLLNKWTIPMVKPKVIYQLGTFERIGLKQVAKTTEETLTVDSDHATFRLLSENDLAHYRDSHRFLHIGLIQVAFKPLTLRGLPESFIAALRDSRNQNWKKSLIGTVQTSLAYGPVYFNAYPNLQISLNDENSLNALILSIKLHDYDYLPGTKVICICYRIHFKPLYTLNPMCRIMDMKNETVLIETNFVKSKVTTRRPIKWDEIDFPKEWVIEEAVAPRNTGNTKVTEIEQTSDSTVKIRFNKPEQIDNISLSSRLTRSNSSYISPIDYVVDFPSRASTSQIRENSRRINEVSISSDNIVKVNNIPDLEPATSEMDFSNSFKNE